MSYCPNDRTEEAFAAVLTAPVLAVNAAAVIATGRAAADKGLPLVICEADGNGEEDPHMSGNFWLQFRVTLKTKSVANEDGTNPNDDPRANAKALLTAILATLMVDNLPALLSAAVADFTVFPNAVIWGSPGRAQEGDVFIDELNGRIYCCGSDLS